MNSRLAPSQSPVGQHGLTPRRKPSLRSSIAWVDQPQVNSVLEEIAWIMSRAYVQTCVMPLRETPCPEAIW